MISGVGQFLQTHHQDSFVEVPQLEQEILENICFSMIEKLQSITVKQLDLILFLYSLGFLAKKLQDEGTTCWALICLSSEVRVTSSNSLSLLILEEKNTWSRKSVHFRQSFKVKQEPRKYEILALKHRDIESSDILCITSASVLEVIMETKLLF